MKLADRHLVEGTEPCIYIGHQVRRDIRTGTLIPRKPWYAEWNEHGINRSETLRTTNKKVAIRRAHEICRGSLTATWSVRFKGLSAQIRSLSKN